MVLADTANRKFAIKIWKGTHRPTFSPSIWNVRFVDVVAEKRYYPIGQAGGEPGKRAVQAIDEGLHNLLHTIKEENMDHTKQEIEEMLADAKKEWDGPECTEGLLWIICAKKPA